MCRFEKNRGGTTIIRLGKQVLEHRGYLVFMLEFHGVTVCHNFSMTIKLDPQVSIQ
jgi:hypothetical protein